MIAGCSSHITARALPGPLEKYLKNDLLLGEKKKKKRKKKRKRRMYSCIQLTPFTFRRIYNNQYNIYIYIYIYLFIFIYIYIYINIIIIFLFFFLFSFLFLFLSFSLSLFIYLYLSRVRNINVYDRVYLEKRSSRSRQWRRGDKCQVVKCQKWSDPGCKFLKAASLNNLQTIHDSITLSKVYINIAPENAETGSRLTDHTVYSVQIYL